ncbi:glycosyl transferase [Marinobacterium zhoushanense]|uniref:Glycosyl transferase n=1 Tax=Marinobacterium zhoushanense TaxID=1679163 RepID=A0ABQ1KF77_9GAMM|nr:glycosyltransferase [Marinobacterium zhoushanense]GGB95097.1 glycosyl transferase [Marinobacterium zhoushanense]
MTGSNPRLLFYVQHLLGIGHIKRAALLVQGWVSAGIRVTVVMGGESVPQFRFTGARVVQLPSLRARDESFSGLVDSAGREPDQLFKQQRTQMLLSVFEAERPDILVIESYPFGRRQLRWELLPLLERAMTSEPRPLIACSVRDIVQGRRPERVAEAVSLIERYFDAVLVHGDRQFVPFGSSFPEADKIEDRLLYTGYVTESKQEVGSESLGKGEVLVSAGGGAVGFKLMESALRGRTATVLANATWRFLVGPNLPGSRRDALQQLASDGVIIEPLRPDFPQLLANCRLSISQGGYNTMMDLLTANARSVVVPFEGEGETEQLERSVRLAALGHCVVVRESELCAQTLAAAVNDAIELQPAELSIDVDGARRSAELLLQRWESTHG